jgi:hypothetical protein
MSERSLIYDDGLAGLKLLSIRAEHRIGVRRYLKTRFRRFCSSNDKYYPTGDRASSEGLVIGNLELWMSFCR